MRFLRQNTAVRITVGPFLDKTDGITPETGLTATNEHITLMVDDDDNSACNLIIDANATASGGDNDMVHVTNDDAGFYDLELTAAQTNYVGRAMLSINYVTDHCPVFHEFMILPANVYDAMTGADKLYVDVSEISSDATAADNCELMYDGTGYAGGTAKLAVDLIDAPNATALAAIADAILKRDWSSVTGEASRSVLNALRFIRNKWSISNGTLTVTKENDSTSAWTAAVTGTSGADPVTAVDPD